MSLMKNTRIGNTNIEIYDDCIPVDKNELRKNITSLYDVVNDISRNLSSKELKEKKIFYTQKELKKVETI